jgi:hypothetical protein
MNDTNGLSHRSFSAARLLRSLAQTLMALAISIRISPPAISLLEALGRRPIPIVIASRRRRIDYAALFQPDDAPQAVSPAPTRRTANALPRGWQPCPAEAEHAAQAYRPTRAA